MAVTTTLKRGYAWRIIIIAVVSGVLGLWGVYDYMVAIPRKAEAHKRSQIYAMVKDALGAQPSAEARAVTVAGTRAGHYVALNVVQTCPTYDRTQRWAAQSLIRTGSTLHPALYCPIYNPV